VCRFLVQGLCSSRGRTKSDFHVDLVLSVDGLLSLIKAIYGILNKHHKILDHYRSLHWRVHFHGDVYTLSDPEIHHFHLLKHPLANGQSGWFEGSNASFRFTVVQAVSNEICPSKLCDYPRISLLPSQPVAFTEEMKDDWLSDRLKIQAHDYRIQFREFMGGANVWQKDECGEYYRDRPRSPKWSIAEEKIMALLIHAGCKFQESWLNVLRHAFVKRSEAGTAQQWYKIRKKQKNGTDSSDSENSGGDGALAQVKTMSLNFLEKQLKEGVPELGEHPLKRTVSDLDENGQGYHDLSSSKRRKVSFANVPSVSSGSDPLPLDAS